MFSFKKSSTVLLLIIALTYSVVVLSVLSSTVSTKFLEVSIYEMNDGYGYKLSTGEKILIKQDFIPAIQRKQSFSSYEDAQKVADLVRKKLLAKEPPTVSLEELKKLVIHFKYVDLP